jgi:hypothetical protein
LSGREGREARWQMFSWRSYIDAVSAKWINDCIARVGSGEDLRGGERDGCVYSCGDSGSGGSHGGGFSLVGSPCPFLLMVCLEQDFFTGSATQSHPTSARDVVGRAPVRDTPNTHPRQKMESAARCGPENTVQPKNQT